MASHTLVSGSSAKVEDVWNLKVNEVLGGHGSDGALYVSGGQTQYLEENHWYNFSSILIASGGTITTSGSATYQYPIYIRVTGNVIISGDVNLSGKGFSAGYGYCGASTFRADEFDNPYRLGEAGCNGRGGGSSVNGHAGFGGRRMIRGFGHFDASTGKILLTCGPGGGTGGVDNGAIRGGGGGGGGAFYSDGTAGGGANDTGNVSLSDGVGGAGGGALYLETNGNLTIASGATINCNGSDGTTGTNGGGGGGGAGGCIWLRYAGTLSNNGSVTVTGGSGASGTQYAGGAGGYGTYSIDNV